MKSESIQIHFFYFIYKTKITKNTLLWFTKNVIMKMNIMSDGTNVFLRGVLIIYFCEP